MIIRDPIRDALRALVRRKLVLGWKDYTRAAPDQTVERAWLVTFHDAPSETRTTDGVNDLIAMLWDAHGTH